MSEYTVKVYGSIKLKLMENYNSNDGVALTYGSRWFCELWI